MPISNCSVPAGKAADRRFQLLRQVIRHEFEMEEAGILGCGLDSLEEEVHDRQARGGLEVEGRSTNLKRPRATRVQRLPSRPRKLVQRERAGALVERRQAELALERAAARCLDVDEALLQVTGAVVPVGQDEFLPVQAARPQ
jgi:hypothetical protein